MQRDYNLIIPTTSVIGDNFDIRHPQGIRIGKTSVIGDNCKVYPYFSTIAKIKGDHERKGQRRHPKIGNDCILGCNATVIGPITIGEDVTIAACAVVSKDVPPHSVVKGINQIRCKTLDEIPDKYKLD